jgi:hypothetical protein
MTYIADTRPTCINTRDEDIATDIYICRLHYKLLIYLRLLSKTCGHGNIELLLAKVI